MRGVNYSAAGQPEPGNAGELSALSYQPYMLPYMLPVPLAILLKGVCPFPPG